MKCPSCKSERCGNHAACARNRAGNEKVLLAAIKDVGYSMERERGKPLSMDEWKALAKDFMTRIDNELAKEKES
jgi:hypothetical protein